MTNAHSKVERLNLDLGKPYMAIIDRAIEQGYAGNKSEVIRQALNLYGKEIDDKEYASVEKAADKITAAIERGEMKTHSLDEIKKRYKTY